MRNKIYLFYFCRARTIAINSHFCLYIYFIFVQVLVLYTKHLKVEMATKVRGVFLFIASTKCYILIMQAKRTVGFFLLATSNCLLNQIIKLRLSKSI